MHNPKQPAIESQSHQEWERLKERDCTPLSSARPDGPPSEQKINDHINIPHTSPVCFNTRSQDTLFSRFFRYYRPTKALMLSNTDWSDQTNKFQLTDDYGNPCHSCFWQHFLPLVSLRIKSRSMKLQQQLSYSRFTLYWIVNRKCIRILKLVL